MTPGWIVVWGILALAFILFVIAFGPIGDDEWPDDDQPPLEVWLEQPVREACELTFQEEIAWQRIRAGA